MLSTVVAVIVAFTPLTLAKESYATLSKAPAYKRNFAPLPAAIIHKRQLLTCNQTYGGDSQVCGGVDSTFCYSPSAGHTCCPDKGYCERGSYCAPVAGFCCAEVGVVRCPEYLMVLTKLQGEDLGTCAQNAGFTIPGTLAVTATVASAVSSVTNAIGLTSFQPDPAQASSTTEIDSIDRTQYFDNTGSNTRAQRDIAIRTGGIRANNVSDGSEDVGAYSRSAAGVQARDNNIL
ncbi:uncharacterized protein JN550_009373 [Neoarthrinium moseri]|uniref:uncharacterized protein n=1 Tax=Neoarthrinium moseri TaxID=1658444 RepID=UPI001FDB2285|nr:uncharacterized protein JN550_009373 [Neoarthrinium moseri]KAI1863875.1 hypothetical protein JN550_009373 [Neoarthrinium moseri]